MYLTADSALHYSVAFFFLNFVAVTNFFFCFLNIICIILNRMSFDKRQIGP